MSKTEFTFLSSDCKTQIHAVRHTPEGEPKAVLQIAHGMVEFIDRYDDFAAFLTGHGYVVVGNDHLGHGASVNSKDDWGYFAKKDGNRALLTDMHSLYQQTRELYPDIPYILMGHSMGSFYARQYICEYGDELDGAIIMGTGKQPALKVGAGLAIINLLGVFTGWRRRSKFVNNMAFGSYNKKFKPARTPVDWLSRNEENVDWYINEERCNFIFTLNGYRGMMRGISRLNKKKLLRGMPKDLPILLVSGAEDPVGNFGKDIRSLAVDYQSLGMNDVRVRLYPEDRHEILNEVDKDKVYREILGWLDSIV